jgi:D-beta-D-heptose 7-phosphate kinase/D-beta-D-heptose 1-phosphate adenosyltransferase
MATRLIELVEKLRPARVLVVGDFMLDRYLFGSTERVSPEAPIPVLRFRREEHRLGGAGFVLAGLSTLGAIPVPVGVLGSDKAGEDVRRQVASLGAPLDGLVTCHDRPTVEKIRLLGSSEDRTAQQMLRLDIEQTAPVDAPTERRLIERAVAAMDSAEVVALEDYDKGVLTPTVCREIIHEAKRRGLPVLVDPARLSDYSKYRGATAIKLNRPETERATGLPARSNEQIRVAAEMLLQSLEADAIVITLNDQGSFLATRDGTRELLSSRTRQVADATGAGDMVLVTLAVARAAGAGWHDAVALANVVAGLEVEKLGCVPITRNEIVHDLLSEHRQQTGKERTLEQLVPELQRHRNAGRRIVFTNGCFDIVHLGHVKYFQFARDQGDLLVVGVNTDASIRRLKGEKRPVVNENDRIGVLEELESIDYLVRFDDDTPIRLIEAIKPDVLVKGADYRKEQVVGWDIVERHGGRVALAPLIDGRSTSNVIRRILDAYGNESPR